MTNPFRAPRRRRAPATVLLVVATLVVAAGCGGGSARNPFDPSSTPSGDRIRIEVQNLNFNDVTVWALRNSQRVRVGRVTGKTDQTFTISWNVAQPIWFEIDVVSGRSCRTPQVPVDADSRVWVIVPSEVGLSACQAGRR